MMADDTASSSAAVSAQEEQPTSEYM